MAPSLRLGPVNRSLVRIPGSGSGGGNAKPLALNLARSLNDFSENLPAMTLFGGSPRAELLASSSSSRENLVRVGLPLFGQSSPRPPGLGSSEPSPGAATKIPGGAGPLSQVGKRPREVSEKSEPKKRVCPSEVAFGTAVAQGNLDVRVPGASCAPDSPSTRSCPSGGKGANMVDAEGGERPKVIMKPQSVIHQLVKVLEERRKQQIECEKEKSKLQEEVADLKRRMATFREIFQDTNKLKAVLQRLNIKI